MKAALKNDKGEVRLDDINIDPPGSDEVRIEVQACGVCGTDLHVSGDDDTMEPFGHEMAGIITETGSCVNDLSAGDAVAVESSSPCGYCDNCHDTRQELCTNIQSFFLSGHFGFQEETNVPAISALPCHDISPEVASLSEPLGVAIDMVRLADITIDNNVLIIGPGCIGLMATALCTQMGANQLFVAGTRRRTARKRLAMEFGADEFITVDETSLTDFDFGCDIDRILVTAPPSTLPDAFEVASKGAIISFIGIEHGKGARCSFNANDFHFKKLQLRASFASPALYTPKALRYLEQNVVPGETLISHRFPLEEIDSAMETARTAEDAVKVIVQP